MKLYQHWKENCHELREAKKEQEKQKLPQDWSSQIEDKIKRDEDERMQSFAIEDELEQERLMAVEQEKKQIEERNQNELERAEYLKGQMQEIKEKEYSNERLKLEEVSYMTLSINEISLI